MFGKRAKPILSIVLLSIAGSPPLPAHAARPKRIAVLPTIIDGPHGAATSADVFQIAAKSARSIVDFEVVAYNAVVVEGATSVAATVRDCASDVPCIARALGERDIELGLRVIVNFAIEPPLVSLGLIEQGPPRLSAESVTEVPVNSSVGAVLEQACDALLARAGFERGGRVVVSASPADATIRVEGDARPTGEPHTYLVRPGRWEVRAERAGHAPAKSIAVVTAGETVNVALVLAPDTTAAAPEEGAPWLWIALGAVAVAGAATAVLVATEPFSSDPARGCVCITTAAGACTPCP